MALASPNEWHFAEVESSVSAESGGERRSQRRQVCKAVLIFFCLVEVSILFPSIYILTNLSQFSHRLVGLTIIRLLLFLLRIQQFSYFLATFFDNFLVGKLQSLCRRSWRQDLISVLLAFLAGVFWSMHDDADVYFTQPALCFLFAANVTLFVVDTVLMVYNLFLCQCMDLSQGSPPKETDDKYADLKVYHPLPVKLSAREGDHGTCSICLGDFKENDEAVQLPCEHVFHRQCAREWLVRSNYCPLRCPEIVLPPQATKAQKAGQTEQDHQDFTPVLPGEVADV